MSLVVVDPLHYEHYERMRNLVGLNRVSQSVITLLAMDAVAAC